MKSLSNHHYLKKILKMAIPMAGTRWVQMLTYFAGMVFAGNLGHTVLASLALINVTFILFYVIGMSMLFSLGVVAAQHYGAKNYHAIGRVFQQALLLTFIITIPISLCFYYADSILKLLGQNPHLMPYITAFFHAALIGVFPMFLVVMIQQLCFAVETQHIVIKCNTITFIIYLPVAYSLIHGWGFVPSFGVKGLAYSLIFSNLLNCSLILYYLYKKPFFKAFGLFKRHAGSSIHHMKKLFQVGWPIIIQFSGEVLIFFIITLMIGYSSTGNLTTVKNQLSAFQIVVQWQGLFIVPMFGVTEAISILIGHAAGAKKPDDMPPLLNTTLKIIAMLCVIVSMLYLIIPDTLAKLYAQKNTALNQQTLTIIRSLFQIATVSLLFDALRNIITGALRGLHDTQYAMWAGTIVMYGITLPLGYWFVKVLHKGIQFYLVAYTIAFIIGAGLVYRRWIQQQRKFQQLITNPGS
jgi:multidrug resistance protein, MATE family